jgi:hypothetical protein
MSYCRFQDVKRELAEKSATWVGEKWSGAFFAERFGGSNPGSVVLICSP